MAKSNWCEWMVANGKIKCSLTSALIHLDNIFLLTDVLLNFTVFLFVLLMHSPEEVYKNK